MRTIRIACLALAAGALAALPARAAEDTRAKKDEIRKALKDTELSGAWVYDDVAAGFEEARKSGKPLLIVFR